MHRRFASAPTSELGCPGGTVRAVVAKSFRLRLLGLMRLDATEVVPLLFPRCRSIHTFGMRTPIDLVWLSAAEGEVLEVVEALGPGRHRRAPRGRGPRRSIAALELAPGGAERLALRAGSPLWTAQPLGWAVPLRMSSERTIPSRARERR